MTGSRVLNGGTNTGIGRALGRRAFPKSITIALAGMCAGLGSTVGNRPSAIAAETLKTLRMGYQKYGTLVLLKTMGALEKRLEPLGIAVTWTEFPDGPKLMEAINLGSIDFGTTGDAPPIVAQAAGTPFVYVGHEPPAPKGEAVVVLDGSPIRSVGDLKGKRLAVNRGSNVHSFRCARWPRPASEWATWNSCSCRLPTAARRSSGGRSMPGRSGIRSWRRSRSTFRFG